jgi:hypothetical protein
MITKFEYTNTTGNVTITIHDIVSDYFYGFEDQITSNKYDVERAKRRGDKAVVAMTKNEGKSSEREFTRRADELIRKTIATALTAAQTTATHPMEDDAKRTLGDLRLRNEIGSAEVNALLESYGRYYQFRVALRDILFNMNSEISIPAGELEPYAHALSRLEQMATARIWHASGTAEKDINDFNSDWMLQKVLSGSSINIVDKIEKVFDSYLG